MPFPREPSRLTKISPLKRECVMRAINIHEAKTHLSRLVEDAARGKAFIIAKAGRPMVKVVPYCEGESERGRRLGFMRGEIEVPDDFDQMMADEIEAGFSGVER